MSKRNKKFRSNRSAFKLEALEQRQLLATIVGGTGGTEVGSDITVSGKIYDQILMTGSSVSVQADAGQTVRVDFMDADGDIVRAEFSGSGTLNISLANFVAAATPTKYAITNNKYVSGLASFTITNSDATSTFMTTSLGPLGNAAAFQGLLNPIFANGTLVGGNNTANVARLVIVGDSTNLVGGAGTAFGKVDAANAIFSDNSGVVGIYAPNTSFKSGSTITVGDILPVGTSATPIISLGLFSDVKTVSVAGGKLASASSGVAYTFTNVTTLASTKGTTSNGAPLPTLALSNGTALATYSSGLGTVTIDGATATTASLDAQYKTQYLQDVIINNGLPAGVILRANQFGNITVNGDLRGVITTDIDSDNLSDTNETSIGNVTINGSILDGGYIESSLAIGNVVVTGGITHTTGSNTITLNNTPGVPDQIAVISTLGRAGLTAAIGNVSVTGDINLGTSSLSVAEGLISANRALNATNQPVSLGSTGGIGNISAANVNIYSSLPLSFVGLGTATSGAVNAGVINAQGPSGQNIGTVTFTGDVVVNNANVGLINSARNIGAISVKSLTMTTPGANGITTLAANNGNIGAITSSGTNGIMLLQGVISAGGSGSVGNISVGSTGNFFMGAGTNGTSSGLTSGLSGGTLGTMTVTSGNLVTGTAAKISSTNGNIGDITLTSGNLTLGAAVTATGGNVGNIILTDTSVGGGVSTIGAKVSSVISNSVGGAIGNITVGKGNLTISAAGSVEAATAMGNITLSNGNLALGAAATTMITAGSATTVGTIGNIDVKGNVTFGAGSKVIAGNGSTQGNTIGNITVAAGAAGTATGTITGASGTATFQANQIGNISVTGGTTAATLLTDVIFAAKGTSQASVASAKIGNITLNSSANSTGDIAAATAVSVSATTGTGFSSSGNIGNVTLTTGSGAGAEIVSSAAGTNNLIIRAGSSNMGLASNIGGAVTAATLTPAGWAVNTSNGAATDVNVDAVSIGDISINAPIDGGNLTKYNTAGSGLQIASGVNNTTNGLFKASSASGGNLLITGTTALTAGTIGNITISDLSGSVVKTPFSNAVLGVLADSAATATNDTGGSIIVADKINGITVNSGPGAILSLSNLSGLPLKGAISDANGIPNTANQQYRGTGGLNEGTDNLVIVVL